MHRPTKLRLTASLLLCFVLQSLGADNYNNNNGQTYEFGFKIDGQQHRHESKDKDGIIMGEFGFVTADDVYHVTVYATDKEGRFKILSMKNIHLKSSPASSPGGFLSIRQNKTRQGKEILPVSASTEKPSCASCLKVEDLPQKSTPSPHYNNSPNQFGVPGTGPQNKQVFTSSPNPYEQQNTSPGGPSVSLNNKPAFPLPPYEQQNISPGGPSVSLNNKPAFPLSPYEQQSISPGGPSVSFNNKPAFTVSPYEQQNTLPGGPSVSLNNKPAFPLSPYEQQNTSPGGPSVSFNNKPAFPLSPYEQQNTSPGGPSVSFNNKPAFPLSPHEQHNTSPGGPSVSFNNKPAFPLSPYEQQNTSPGGPIVSFNNKPAFPLSPYEQQNTSPGGPSVSLNNKPAFPLSPYEQQNTSPGGPSVSLNNKPAFPLSPYEQQNISPGGPSISFNNKPAFPLSPYEQHNTSPDGPSVSSHNKHTGERTAKQLEPNGSRGPVVVPNQRRPAKPTLVTAQMQIVDKNTDIYALGPNEMKGLPPGLSSDDITTLLYTFNYTVGFHGHFEEGYTNGVKKGYYFVTGRNGVRTRIDYIADDTGFHPTITNDVLDILSEDVPKPDTEKDEKYGLKGYEFKWLFYPVESKRH